MPSSAETEPRRGSAGRLAIPYVRARATLDERWDAIVIGAGVGGLVAAALLARRGGLRVLVLERHYRLGGLTQVFDRRRYSFDVGVHYVGGMGSRRSPIRRLFDLVTEGRLAWNPLPRIYDRVRIDGQEVAVGGGPDALREAYARFCPGEEPVVRRYLDDVRECARRAPGFLLSRGPAADRAGDRAPFFRWADVTTAEHLDRLGASRRLSALLTASFGNYGCPPWRSSFAAHAMATAHYFDGGAYPVGGGGRVGEELAATLTRHGGAVVVRAEVAAILRRGDRAIGVELSDGRQVRAPLVISDAGAETTFERLVDDGAPAIDRLRDNVRAIGPSDAHTALYIGLSRDPGELGLSGSNLWAVGTDTEGDAARLRAWLRGAEGAPDGPPGFFVSNTCANDPSWPARMPGRSAIVASVVAPYGPFERWTRTARGRRGPEYEAWKARLTRQMLAQIVAHVPQIEGAIDHVEMSTPLSTRHFTGHSRGQTCGLDHGPARFRLAPGVAAPLRGLFLTGQDAWMCGVSGAAFGGLVCADAILRQDLLRALVF